MKFNRKVPRMLLLLFIILCIAERALGQKSFVVSFQSKQNGVDSATIDEWIELANKMPSTKEFTACNWIKPRYFNTDIAINLWSYCTIGTAGDPMVCIQMFLHSRGETAHREVVVYGEIEREYIYSNLGMNVKAFSHRSWAHLCWSLSSITGQSKYLSLIHI